MFTLSGLILEARENLFRDFWSPFSISFYFSSERNYFKKRGNRPAGRVRLGLPARRGFISRPTPGRGNPSPAPRPSPAAAAAAAGRHRTPPEVRRLVFLAGFFFRKTVDFSSVLLDLVCFK